MPRRKTALFTVLTASLLGSAATTGCTAKRASDSIVADAVGATNIQLEPERVIRAFMIAMAKGDLEGMLVQMKPNPDVRLILQRVNRDDEAELVELFRTLPISRLWPGDELTDPFVPGQKLPEMPDEDYRVYCMHTKGKDAWTFFLIREAGRWRVNMDWFIEGLKHPGSKLRIVPGSPPRVVV